MYVCVYVCLCCCCYHMCYKIGFTKITYLNLIYRAYRSDRLPVKTLFIMSKAVNVVIITEYVLYCHKVALLLLFSKLASLLSSS